MNAFPTSFAPPANQPASTSTADVTFVVCVESGPLETQTVLAVESLRRWGGRFAGCPVLAITPRKGFALSKKTRKAFERLNMTWHGFDARHEAPWYGPMNKPAALAFAEEWITTGTVAWMDSDVLVVGEPNALELTGDFQFTAFPGSRVHDLGTDGDDGHFPFWRESLVHHQIDPEAYPFIPSQPGESGPIKMYWQGGVYAYCRATSLGKAHLHFSRTQLDSRIASRECGAYFTEQVGLALGVFLKQLRWRVLPESCNLAMNPLLEEQPSAEIIAQARIIHYFGSLWPDSFPAFVEQVSSARPDVAEWLESHGPLRDSRPVHQRVVNRLRRSRFRKAANRYLQSCEAF